MEAYAQVLSYAIPGFILLIIAEAIGAFFMKKEINNSFDLISSLSSGITNTLKSIIGLSIVIVSYDWMVSSIALFEIKSTLLIYILAFIGIDFASYWSHRFNHEFNVLWNRHIIHHSSEEFNLSCALRQPISNVLSIYFFLYIPLALIGISAEVVALLAPLHLFAQFWYHTRLIDRMGVLEHVLVTPSHHRVHHAINDEYIDKNYAAIFILWDKWFGTFQEEHKKIPPVYGTKKPVASWNPFWINYMHLWSLVKDVWMTRDAWAKIKIWFMPTGWRPQDLTTKEVIPPVMNREKYKGIDHIIVKWLAWFAFSCTISLLVLTLIRFTSFDFPSLVYLSIYIALSIYTYTATMDGHYSSLISLTGLWGLFLWLFLMSPESWYFLDTFWGLIGIWGYQLLLTIGVLYVQFFILPKYHQEHLSSGSETALGY